MRNEKNEKLHFNKFLLSYMSMCVCVSERVSVCPIFSNTINKIRVKKSTAIFLDSQSSNP